MCTITLYLPSMLQESVPVPTCLFFLWNQVVEIGKAFPNDGSGVNQCFIQRRPFIGFFYLSIRQRKILIFV